MKAAPSKSSSTKKTRSSKNSASGTSTKSAKEINWSTVGSTALKRYKEKLFQPNPKIRSLDLSKLVGQTVQVQLAHANADQTDQMASINELQIERFCGSAEYISGWLGGYLGKQSSVVKLKVSQAYITGHNNGGRQSKHALTYNDFYDATQKKLVHALWTGGIEGRIVGGMRDFDRADIIVEFDNGMKLDSFAWGLKAPEEWYSELYENLPEFKFEDGFFDTAEEAIESFKNSSVDDMFGTRYFPVCVFPLKVQVEKHNVVGWAKAHSSAILLSDRVVYGTRCKPDEYEEVIRRTYAAGGAIARNRTWDWS